MSTKAQMDELLKGFVVPGKGPAGCGCAVAKDGEIIYEGYYGMANLEKQQPITRDTVYRLYSMTKVIICTAAMMLQERGKFLLNDPLYEYFPSWRHMNKVVSGGNGRYGIRPLEKPIEVRHAFSMAMGMPYPELGLPTDQAMLKVRARLAKENPKYDLLTEIDAMSEVPVAFEPGTRFLYGFGHELVAGLIQVVSGKKVSEFLKEELFEPLGMNSTGYRFFGDIRDRMAVMYHRDEDGTLTDVSEKYDDRLQEDAVYEGGGAGLFSTVPDYLAFTQMLAAGGTYRGHHYIGRKTIDLMRQNQLNETQLKDFRNSYLAGYGYGLGVRTMMDPGAGYSPTSVGEFGWTGMAGTYTSIDPSEGFSVVYMHQLDPNMEEEHHHRIRSVAYGLLR